MFGFLFKKVDEEKLGKVRKKCKLDMSAFSNCTKAYAGETDLLGAGKGSKVRSKACETLRNQVLHCYSRAYCEEASAAYERCYHLAVNKGRLLVDYKTGEKACEAQVAKMEKCLKRQRVLPPELKA